MFFDFFDVDFVVVNGYDFEDCVFEFGVCFVYDFDWEIVWKF